MINDNLVATVRRTTWAHKNGRRGSSDFFFRRGSKKQEYKNQPSAATRVACRKVKTLWSLEVYKFVWRIFISRKGIFKKWAPIPIIPQNSMRSPHRTRRSLFVQNRNLEPYSRAFKILSWCGVTYIKYEHFTNLNLPTLEIWALIEILIGYHSTDCSLSFFGVRPARLGTFVIFFVERKKYRVTQEPPTPRSGSSDFSKGPKRSNQVGGTIMRI